MRALFLPLALLCANASAAVASEQQWIDAATKAVAFGQAQGLPISLQVETGDGLPGHTPVGIQSEAGACTLVVSARDNPTAARLSETVAPASLDLFLEGAAIHEVGHCYRRLAGYPHNERLLPVVSWIGFVRDWFTRRVRTEEAFADLTEAAWLARYHPDRYDELLAQVEQVRERFREPKHDTLAWLAAARQEGPRDDGGSVFAQATTLLSRRN